MVMAPYFKISANAGTDSIVWLQNVLSIPAGITMNYYNLSGVLLDIHLESINSGSEEACIESTDIISKDARGIDASAGGQLESEAISIAEGADSQSSYFDSSILSVPQGQFVRYYVWDHL